MDTFPNNLAACHRLIQAVCVYSRVSGTRSRPLFAARAIGQGLRIATSLALGPAVEAASFSWDGELSQDWHSSAGTKTNWDPDGFPGESDTAMIDGSHVNLNDPAKLAGLDVFSSLSIGRTLTIGSDASISNLTINGGLLAGPGAIALYAQSVLNSGGFESASQVTNHGTFTINPGFGEKAVGGSTFTNLGTINALSGLPFVNSTLVNTGNCNLINSALINTLNSTVQNTGTVTGTAAANINMRLLNPGGTLAARTTGSTLSVTRGSEFTGGAIAVEDDATVQLGGTEQHIIGGTLTASGLGSFSFNSTGIRIDGEVQAALNGSKGLWLLAGSTTGPGKLVNTRRAFLEGTAIGNDGGLENSAPGGSSSLFLGSQFNHAVNSRLVNTGQIIHQSRPITIGSGGQIINETSGIYEFAGIEAASVVGAGTLVNRGLIEKKGLTDASISSVLDLAGGTVHVQVGTLMLLGTGGGSSGGTFQVAAGAALKLDNLYTFTGNYQFAGNGTANFASTLIFTGGDTTLDLPIGGVSFNDNTRITVAGAKLENRGKFGWTASGVIDTSITGRFVNAAGGTLNMAGQPFLLGTMENEGTVTQAAAASLRVGSNSAFVNRSAYDVTYGGMVMRDAGTHLFSNAVGGNFTKSGYSDFTVDVPFNNQGTVILKNAETSGGRMYLQQGGSHGPDAVFRVAITQELFLPGTHSASGAVTFEGEGSAVLQGTYVASSGTTKLNLDVLGFSLAGNSAHFDIRETGMIDNFKRFTWSVGSISGGVIDASIVVGGFRNSSETTLAGTSAKTLRGVFHNAGAIRHQQGLLRLDAGARLVNDGTYVFTHLNANPSVQPLTTGGRFLNRGILAIDGSWPAGNLATVSVPVDSHNGRIEVASGLLVLSGGGNHTGDGIFKPEINGIISFSGGSHDFSGQHTAIGSGTVRLTAGQIIGDFVSDLRGSGEFILAGGTLNGPETQPVKNLGNMRFEGGTITGTGGLRNESEATATVATAVTVSGRLTNAGTLTVLGSLNLTGTLHNLSGGVMSINGTGLLSGSTGLFDNEGLLTTTRPGVTIAHRVNNRGWIHVLNPSQLTLSGPVDQFDPLAGTLTGGSWRVEGNLTLGSGQPIRTLNATVEIKSGGSFINLPTSVVGNFTNQGRLVLLDGITRSFTGVFTNTGELEVGANLQLTATGGFSNSGTLRGNGTINGQLISTIGSTVAPGSSIGTLTLTGPVTLGGALQIEIDATSADHLIVAGQLDISAAALEVLTIGIPSHAVYHIASYGTLTGNFASHSGIPAGYTVHYNFKGLNQIALVGASDDYLLWAAGFAGFDMTAPSADHDGDGLTNHEEYTFGLNPTSGASVAPITAALSPTSGIFKYTRRQPALTGLKYTYEFSTTLGGGSWAAFTPMIQTSNGSSPVEEISVTIPANLLTAPTGFFRVKAH